MSLNQYVGKVMLAPMVRIGTLPARLLALQYGADLVYTEEIIDHKILQCERVENKLLGTVDFNLPCGTTVFRTNSAEKDKVIFQMGTADPARALRVAKLVENDVAGIDINMGCPKDYSVKGGMGAALLSKPDLIKDILTTLVTEIKSIPITCKIRLLSTIEDTRKLLKVIESTGVAAVGLHGRFIHERPREPAHYDWIKTLAEGMSIPVIANGGSLDINTYEDVKSFWDTCKTPSVMLARSAQWNLSVFRKEGLLPLDEVIKDYLKLSIQVDN
eukprot:Colp12_sorted_trinity150504_noHs@15923